MRNCELNGSSPAGLRQLRPREALTRATASWQDRQPSKHHASENGSHSGLSGALGGGPAQTEWLNRAAEPWGLILRIAFR